jgi:hypothetical protein
MPAMRSFVYIHETIYSSFNDSVRDSMLASKDYVMVNWQGCESSYGIIYGPN